MLAQVALSIDSSNVKSTTWHTVGCTEEKRNFWRQIRNIQLKEWSLNMTSWLHSPSKSPHLASKRYFTDYRQSVTSRGWATRLEWSGGRCARTFLHPSSVRSSVRWRQHSTPSGDRTASSSVRCPTGHRPPTHPTNGDHTVPKSLPSLQYELA